MWLVVLIFSLSLFSAVWLWLGISYIVNQVGTEELWGMNPSDLAVMITAISAPILISVLVAMTSYNFSYLKQLFNNQQSFIVLFRRKLELSERIEEKKLQLQMLDYLDKVIGDLYYKLGRIVVLIGVISPEEVQKVWQRFSEGYRDIFANYLIDPRSSGAVTAKIEAKVAQDDNFSIEVDSFCSHYDNIYDLLLKYDAEQIQMRFFETSPLCRAYEKIVKYKKQPSAGYDPIRHGGFRDDFSVASEFDEDNEPVIDWTQKRNELIDKYRSFAGNIRDNIEKGALKDD